MLAAGLLINRWPGPSPNDSRAASQEVASSGNKPSAAGGKSARPPLGQARFGFGGATALEGPAGRNTGGGPEPQSLGGPADGAVTGAPEAMPADNAGPPSADSDGGPVQVDPGVAAPDADALFTARQPGADVEARPLGLANDEQAPGSDLESVETVPADDPSIVYASGQDARFSTTTRVEVPKTGDLSGTMGTVSFQFEPGWSGDNQADASLVEIGAGRLLVRKNVNFLRLEITDDAGNEVGTGTSVAEWEPGEPHQVTATWAGGLLSLYVDAQLAAQEHYTNRFEIPPGTPVYVGDGSRSAPVAPGVLTDVQLSKQPLGTE